MSRADHAARTSATDAIDEAPARLTPRHLEESIQVLRDVSLAVDDGRTWKVIHGALTAPESTVSNARLSVIERQLHQMLTVVSAAPPPATYVGNGFMLLPTSLGFPLIGFADDLQLTPALVMHRQWDTPTTHLLERILRPGERFLDIGANIGYFTVFGAMLVGGTGRVHAFEANPRTAEVLRRNVRMNTVGHVCTVRDVALGDRTGTATLHTFVGSQASSTLSTLPDRLLDEWHERPREQPVSMTTLDEAFADSDDIFSCIKMDAEGSEARIWAGADRFFQTHVDDRTIVLLEWNPPGLTGAGADRRALLATFARHGFMVWRRDDQLTVTRITDVSQLDDWCNAELVLARDPARVAAVCP
ncbi:MAG TPA: FkbM family methyltransferase [Vicinamibacterales bacterium]|jgi:FkbM family methyltransferase|nr:FkbM family methyltransferase [Vicinamibacterales bacterium]